MIDPTTQSAFTLQSVSFEIGEKIILSDISIGIDAHKITGIIGPSGAGKSTFLRLLNKLISPTKGMVLYQNQSMAELPSQQLRKEIGMVQQQPFLFDGTVKENLQYGPKIWDINYSEEDLVNLLEKVALTAEFLERDVDGLSVGEQQRVSLARSLANEPKVLLLDEPTSALDIASEEIIETTIRSLAKDGLKIVIVTHSLEQTERLTESLLFLRDGTLIEKSKTDDFFAIYDQQEIRSFFKQKEEE
ncbi:MAG: ATP-binding cassette domain-containing protein [Candidatus Heimdallarchaeota archaeon]|nr:ATP-binding cassette domain-containing protein [Candidatus Heimdallarchaeota archaeon]